MEKKIIEVCKHPYMWKVEVTFGTLEEMLENQLNVLSSKEIEIGGSFNKRINEECGRRAALINIGVEISPSPSLHRFPKAEEIKEVNGICMCPWDGVYWYVDYFDEYIKRGLYPVKADWDGNTYIKRGIYNGKDKNGIPIWVGDRYELTDTFRY